MGISAPTPLEILADIAFQAHANSMDDRHEAMALAVAAEVLKRPGYWVKALGIETPFIHQSAAAVEHRQQYPTCGCRVHDRQRRQWE